MRYGTESETARRRSGGGSHAIAALALAACLFLSAGVARLDFNDSYRAFFSGRNPELAAYDAFEPRFGQIDNMLFVAAPASGDVFTPEVLAAVSALTEEAWRLPYAVRVDSLTNHLASRSENDDLIVEPLIADLTDPAAIAEGKAQALSDALLLHRLLPPDGSVAGVNVGFHLPRTGREEESAALAAGRALARRIESENPGLRIHLTGTILVNASFKEAALRDLMTLGPLMFAGIAATTWFLLRSLAGAAATGAIVALSVSSAVGLLGWSGVPLTAPSSSAPIMILTLAVADCIHLINTALHGIGRGLPKAEAIAGSLRSNHRAVFLTSATTALGFLSLNFSDVPPLRDLGNVTAAGVIAAYVLSVTVLPALLRALPLGGVRAQRKSAVFDGIAAAVIARPGRVLAVTAALTLAAASGLPRNTLDDPFVKYFGPSMVFRRDTDFIMERLTGMYRIHFGIESGEAGGAADPAYLERLDAFAKWCRAQPHVTHVDSFSDIMKRLNQTMEGGAPESLRLPGSRESAAQYLLLYSLSLPLGRDLTAYVAMDQSATQLTVTMANVTSREIRRFADASEAWLAANAPAAMHAKAIGAPVMFTHIAERNMRSMLIGAAAALAGISALLAVSLRSLKYGVVTLIPNLVPAAAAFGVWGYTNGQVNLGASLVCAMSLGIVVDDTIHFMTCYVKGRKELGLPPAEAVRVTFRTVGPALFATSAILAAGFLVLTLSSFQFNAAMGTLTAITIGCALATDLFLLPALLLLVDRDPAETGEER